MEDKEAAVAKARADLIEAAVPVVREIARLCREAGRRRADSVVTDKGVLGFADWAEAEIRALVP